MNLYRLDRRLFTGCAIAAIALLGACGGSGGTPVSSTPNPTPTPTPAPSPAPTPTPTPTPTASFNTEEFRSSDGPDFHNAVTAWSEGIAGQGSTIAVIDTGIDSDSPEFAGRLSSASADVAGSRGVDNPDDDHGTDVAMIAAAARDNTGILGIAWEATIIAFRADTPGTCTDTDGCSFDDRDIAAGLDAAVSNGATVVNLSLGGGAPSQELVGAVSRAANAGVVVVVSAGNDGDSTDPAIDPDNPDPFAAGLVAAGNGNVIIVGSVDAAGVISDFSNRAGSSAGVFITARGEAICCTYKDGVLDVQTDSSGSFVTLFSGTSFSAPQVSGAVALLAQAFPNLTASQIVDIILSSARDAGAAGTDAIYGTGILDIARAFAPQGTTTLANTTVAIQPGAPGGTTSGSMGDALTRAYLPAIVTDAYNRAYVYDMGRSLAAAATRRTLQGAVGSNDRQLGSTIDRLSLSFTVSGDDPGNLARLQLAPADAEMARVLAARAALRIAPGTKLAFGYAQGADGLVMQLQGQPSPAFLVAGEGRGNDGFVRRNDASFAVRQQIGPWGLTLSADSGRAWNTAGQPVGTRFGAHRRRQSLRGFGIAADRQFGPVAAALGLNWLSEDETVLGASFEGPLDRPGANSLFIDASATVRLARDWRLGGSFRQGFTRAEATQFVASGSNLASQAWSLDLSHAGTFAGSDTLGLRISQPLRVSGGGLNLYLPVSYDYGSESATYGIRRLSLAPTGREVDGEIAWRGPLWGGDAAASLFYRTDPGHDSRLPDDQGVAVKWNKRFYTKVQ